MNWNPMKIDVKVVWNWDGDNKKSYRIMFKLWFDIKSTFLSEFLISFFLLHKQHCKRFLDRNSYIATWKFSHVKSLKWCQFYSSNLCLLNWSLKWFTEQMRVYQGCLETFKMKCLRGRNKNGKSFSEAFFTSTIFLSICGEF